MLLCIDPSMDFFVRLRSSFFVHQAGFVFIFATLILISLVWLFMLLVKHLKSSPWELIFFYRLGCCI